ncbi:MAG TPA: hypothetical protein VF040_22195 [Ktedonobacterales bacterium]
MALGLDALLFGALKLLDGLLWRGQVFGHRATKIGNGFTEYRRRKPCPFMAGRNAPPPPAGSTTLLTT